MELYDCKSIWTILLAEFKTHIYNSSEFCFIEVQKKKNREFETILEAFDRFNEQRDALLEKSKNFGIPMDIKMCGGSIKIMALWLFEKCSYAVPPNDP